MFFVTGQSLKMKQVQVISLCLLHKIEAYN